MGLIDEMLAGDARALARLITLLENDEVARQEILKRIYSCNRKISYYWIYRFTWCG